ncbi:MAG: methylmalonyl-CoA epimerase [Pseudomonadota bacterium]
MKIKKIDHIGIAVKSCDPALKFYEGVLGIKSTGSERVEEQKAATVFLPIGDSELELLESTSPDGAIAKFIEKRGEGIQHICFEVENIEESLKELKGKGIQLIDEAPRRGAGGARIAFLHPKSTYGVLIELSER